MAFTGTNIPQSQPRKHVAKRRKVPTSQALPSTSFVSPNMFDVLSEDSDSDEDSPPLPPSGKPATPKSKVPPVVLYSYITNHSTSLKTINQKLSAPLEVKTKKDRLILYPKTSDDYNLLLNEVKSTNLPYHTYPLKEAIQPRFVVKGLPPNLTIAEIEEDFKEKYNVTPVQISQLTKTDKTTNQSTPFPIFIVLFPAGTDRNMILKIKTLCHCRITWEKFKNSRPVRQCHNCQSFGHSSIFCARQPHCVKCGKPHKTADCTKTQEEPPACSNCGGPHTANYSKCPKYQQQVQLARNQHQPSTRRSNHHSYEQQPSTGRSNHHSYEQAQFPALQPTSGPSLSRTWARTAGPSTSRSSQPSQNPSSLSDVFTDIKTFLSSFNLRAIGATIRSFVSELSRTTDPMSKMMLIIDLIVKVFSP